MGQRLRHRKSSRLQYRSTQLLKIQLQQLRAEVEQSQPAVLLRFHIKKLLHGMRALLFRPEFQTPYQQFEVKKYMALFSLAVETSRRGDDISLLLKYI